MEWWGGRVSLGNLDLAGAVNKLQESVKNIEKNFDTALGFEERLDSGSQGQSSGSPTQSSNNSEILSHRGEEKESELKDAESLQDDARSPESKDNLPEQAADPQDPYLFQEKRDNETGVAVNLTIEPTLPSEEVELKAQKEPVDFGTFNILSVNEGSGKDSSNVQNSTAPLEPVIQDVATTMESTKQLNEEDKSDMQSSQESESMNKSNHCNVTTCKSSDIVDAQENIKMLPAERVSLGSQAGIKIQYSEPSGATGNGEPRSPIESTNHRSSIELPNDEVQIVSDVTSEENHAKPGTIEVSKFFNVAEVDSRENVVEVDSKEHRLSSASNVSDAIDAVHELEKVKREMKMMETALQGAGRQAQAKADEIAKLINENEQLKFVVEDLKRKSNDAEMESLREECHQRVATLERKVYALTKERDALRREQSKRSDAAALLKEKDEIINQVMAEGEELSKKQAAQEAQIRKLRAQTRELEEEKKSLITKLQLEENKVESIRKDKAATEKLLQETIEKHQAELADQKEYYTSALIAAKEAEELAEARASNEARTELEGHLREAEEREAILVQALEELRQALSRQEQQAISKEDMLRRDIEDLQKRYQASERRCEELVSQLPESTRPLLRQIEAMQEASAQKAEAWAAVERTLQSRLQEAEAKAAAAEERERSINERLSQTLSRVNVLEAQIPCLRAEQTQLNRSLEKERQRAAESRQEYLAAKEEADTHEGRAYQLEVEIRELKRKHKNDLQESLAYRELLQQELEREKAIRLDLEKAARMPSSSAVDQNLAEKSKSELENGKLMRQLSTPSSVGNMEKSFFLEASLDSSRSFLEKRGAAATNPYCLKSMAPSAFEAALRQKEGELASYMSRLASMESIRDSLAEELVKMTEQCDKLRTEAAMLPGIRAELQALRRRHTAALELMGERDEELEELRADIVDLKEMYREQVNLLVNKIQILSSQVGIA